MESTDYFKRIMQEIGYSNYSEVKRIVLKILRSDPNNKEASYIRDYIEFHKKPNGRYEEISLNSYLYYISSNIRKFRSKTDNQFFLKCVYKDFYNISRYGYFDGLIILRSNYNTVRNVLEQLEQCNNPDLENLIKKLKDVQSELFSRIEYEEKEEREREQKELERREREEEEAYKRERAAKIKVITFIVITIVIIIALLSTCK